MTRKEYIVVVTGIAPYKEFKTNPAANVKDELPEMIERHGLPPIRIIKYPRNFRNSYADIDIIRKLWNRDKRVYDPDAKEGENIYVDAMLHLGRDISSV